MDTTITWISIYYYWRSCAANAHGKSCAIHGTIRNSIKSILLFHKKHGWINLSENENKEIFDLTIGGLV